MEKILYKIEATIATIFTRMMMKIIGTINATGFFLVACPDVLLLWVSDGAAWADAVRKGVAAGRRTCWTL